MPRHDGRSTIQLQLTPMVDVVFLLLVFFLWTSSFEEPEFDLPGALAEPPGGLRDPTAAPPPPEAFDEVVIAIAQQEAGVTLSLNGSPVADVEGLAARLAEIASLGVQPPVIVDPDAEVPVGVAVDVYDTARAAGLSQVLFAADSE